jgi:ATP-dependent helicase HrpB
MVGGRGVRLSPRSVVRESELFLAHDPREERRQGKLELQVDLASSVELSWLEELLPELLRRERTTGFDAERQRVTTVSQLWYQDLLIREGSSPVIDRAVAASLLAAALRERASSLFGDDPSASAWLARYSMVREAIPELCWPEITEGHLEALLEPLCNGRTSVQEVLQANKVPYLESLLDATQQRELAVRAPLSIQVPSGRNVRLLYEPSRPPVLAVKLQELFGWSETPRLARGRIPVLLHLLGPNARPVQITSDLASFWNTTYHQVRKDLRRRYPKHAWPEDPRTARAMKSSGKTTS